MRSVLGSSPFLRHTLTLVSGTAAAQGVVLVMTPVLSRVYSDSDFGALAAYTAIVSIISAVAALRYDMTIMLPREESWALACARLALVCLTAVSLLASLLALPLRGLIADRWGQAVADWAPMIGVTCFLLSAVQLLQYWYNRQSDYRAIAVNRAEQQIGQTSGQLILGLAGMATMGGLLIGQTIGQAWALVNLGRKARPLRAPLPPGAPGLREVARRYRRMPLLNGANAFVDAIRLNGINLLIGAYSVASLGQFSMAWRCLEVPLALINGAVSQVFFHKLSTLSPGQMRPLVRQVITRAVLIGVAPFALIYLLAPWFFPVLLGPQWDQAGGFARALTPWLFMTLITSPLSNLFVVTENQDWMLAFSLLYAAVPLGWLAVSPYGLLTTTYVLGALMAVLLMGMTLMADAAARRFDARPAGGGADGQAGAGPAVDEPGQGRA